jgi:hypothetical protein
MDELLCVYVGKLKTVYLFSLLQYTWDKNLQKEIVKAAAFEPSIPKL